MYIIVVGGGEIGYHLSRVLIREGHEVLIIEKDAAICKQVREEMGSVIMRGDGCEAAVLDEAGTGRADMLIAVTGDDEDNLVACQVAKHKFNVPHTIARLKNPRHESLFKKLGVDVTVSSTELILAHIAHEVPSHPLISLLKLKRGALEIVEVRIPPDSAAIGKRLRDLSFPTESVVCLVIGKTTGPQIPTPDTIIEAEDEVVAVTASETEAALRAALTGL